MALWQDRVDLDRSRVFLRRSSCNNKCWIGSSINPSSIHGVLNPNMDLVIEERSSVSKLKRLARSIIALQVARNSPQTHPEAGQEKALATQDAAGAALISRGDWM